MTQNETICISIINVALTIFLLSFALSSCYDDGPLISTKSAWERVDGTYEVEKFEVGGVDSTATYKSKPCYRPILFRYVKNREPDEGTISLWDNGIPCSESGVWSIRGNNIRVDFAGTYPTMGPWGGFGDVEWEIKELRDEEMTFECRSFNITYKIRLREI